MPDLIRCLPFARILAILPLIGLGACHARRATPSSHFELIGVPAGTACESAPPGELRLSGLDTSVRLQVSGEELCSEAPIRRELPPGLYSLSWHGTAQRDELDTGEAPPLHGPSVVSLFAGQLTRVRVQVEADPSSLCSSSS